MPGKVTGLFFGDTSQFIAECIGVATNVIYVGGMTAIALFVIGKLVGNRVSAEDEIGGLDIPEMGVLAYPDDAPAHAAMVSGTNESGVGVTVPKVASAG